MFLDRILKACPRLSRKERLPGLGRCLESTCPKSLLESCCAKAPRCFCGDLLAMR
jgi:hypothetical protein